MVVPGLYLSNPFNISLMCCGLVSTESKALPIVCKVVRGNRESLVKSNCTKVPPAYCLLEIFKAYRGCENSLNTTMPYTIDSCDRLHSDQVGTLVTPSGAIINKLYG